MTEYSSLFDKNLVFWEEKVKDRDELYQKIAKHLEKLSIVKSSYYGALTKRENEFPTGLKTEYLPIALPHANPENVNQAFIAVVRTKNPISMKTMGTSETVNVKNFFFLGIVKEKQNLQVKLLQRFMQLMTDQDFVIQFKKLSSVNEVYNFLVNRF